MPTKHRLSAVYSTSVQRVATPTTSQPETGEIRHGKWMHLPPRMQRPLWNGDLNPERFTSGAIPTTRNSTILPSEKGQRLKQTGKLTECSMAKPILPWEPLSLILLSLTIPSVHQGNSISGQLVNLNFPTNQGWLSSLWFFIVHCVHSHSRYWNQKYSSQFPSWQSFCFGVGWLPWDWCCKVWITDAWRIFINSKGEKSCEIK